MAHVGVQGLRAGGGEEAASQDHDSRMVIGRKQERDAAQRVESQQDGGVAQHVDQAVGAQEQEPEGHDGAKSAADLAGARALHGEQQADDDKGDDDHVGLPVANQRPHGGNGPQALDGRGNGDGGGEDAVCQQRGATQHSRDNEPFTVFSDDAVQGEDTAFAVVSSLERDQHVLNRGQQGDRPDNQRQGSQDEFLGDLHDAALACEQRLGDVHGRGADIAVDDAQRYQHGGKAHRDVVTFIVPVSVLRLLFRFPLDGGRAVRVGRLGALRTARLLLLIGGSRLRHQFYAP